MSEDQQIIDKFLIELTEEVATTYGDHIDFIILFGSTARGEFKRGISDIDLVIQLKDDAKLKQVEDFATEVFWQLDKKYDTQFEKVLSTVKSKDIVDGWFKKVEETGHLYVPIFVFPPGWIDWERGRFTRPLWRSAAIFFIHQAFILKRFKEEGKILWGRDIRPYIHPNINFWERWKAIQIPFWISLFSVLILPISRQKALKYSVKAILYELDSALDFVDARVKEKEEKITKLKKTATFNVDLKFLNLYLNLALSLLRTKDLEIFNLASKIKSSEITLSNKEKIKFVWRTFWFITITNWSVTIRRVVTKKNLLKVGIALLVIAILVYFSVGFYALYKLIHLKLKPLTVEPQTISANYENISFKSRDGKVNIAGWFFKADSSNRTIILVSGSDQNRIDPGFGSDKVARDLLANDFNVLMFDFRGRGQSDKAVYSIGYYEKYDLAGAYDYLINRGYKPEHIGVISISLGGGTAVLALPLMSQVGGLVLDSSYSDTHTLIARELPGRSGLPKIFSWGISFWARIIYRVKFDEMVPKDTLKNYRDRKFLIIHGTTDKYIPVQDSLDLAKSSPKSELWIVPEAGHVKAYEKDPKDYIRRVSNYFNEELR